MDANVSGDKTDAIVHGTLFAKEESYGSAASECCNVQW